MHRDANVIGPNVAKFRYQQNLTQDDLVGKLQLLGCYMTRNILGSIETQRCPATEKQIGGRLGVTVPTLATTSADLDQEVVDEEQGAT